MLWIARTGSPWRDLPERLGNWNTAFRRFRDWRGADVIKRIFDALPDNPDLEYAMVDATIVKVQLMPGQRFDSVEVPPLIDGIALDGLIADRALDSNAILTDLDERGAAVIISQHPGASRPAGSTRPSPPSITSSRTSSAS